MEYILYFAETCPDTAPFKEKLAELGITYKEVEVMSSLKNFKEFLFVRDTYTQFEGIRGNMKIGIPCLVISESECILELSELTKLK
ncbi:hypothetical protein [Gemella haemolysans]|jgi:uncharacterized protein HI_0926|uniref:Glutaredoxin domain-containing protein n=2 Tax=Gemella haemolysans TaxID=1379 RepID=A0AA87AJD9_9BACL|nr:hypothetical protein [Gemella haemolysans]EGF85787.1 hypothetical protein HMPREF0428_00629 [Gemella haemolysans M341]MDU6573544.1 hypothetical protein [Gemella haemolysans]PMC47763.1 hypothetical protein CJ217_07160 [Streptococcus sp. UMB1385]QIX87554.1 hypothetical protein FOC48_01680 [Gemella haemolysans]